MTFVINEPTCSSTGQAVRNCGCGQHQRVANAPALYGNDDKLPAGGSLAERSAMFGPDNSQQRAEVRGNISIPSQAGMVLNDRLPVGGSLAAVSAIVNGH